MADPRLAAAFARVDRALDRLEADHRGAAALVLRHERLREATAEAVAGLDEMLAEGAGGDAAP